MSSRTAVSPNQNSRPSLLWRPSKALQLLATVSCVLLLVQQSVAAAVLDRRKDEVWNVSKNLTVDNQAIHITTFEDETQKHENLRRSERGSLLDNSLSTFQYISDAILRRDSSSSASQPRAFDTNLSNNFTNPACPAFFNTFLSDPAFISCHPVSLMLQTSMSFFDSTKTFSAITNVLTTSCGVDMQSCNNVMSAYATQLLQSENCLDDYDLQNPQVIQAYNGFLAYVPIFQATCFKDGTHQNNFCFADAVTNSSSPSNSYPYYLALGTALPAGAEPTCNSCLQRTLVEYANYATNSSQPISLTYNTAASVIDMMCGVTFANDHVTVQDSASALIKVDIWMASILIGATLMLI